MGRISVSVNLIPPADWPLALEGVLQHSGKHPAVQVASAAAAAYPYISSKTELLNVSFRILNAREALRRSGCERRAKPR